MNKCNKYFHTPYVGEGLNESTKLSEEFKYVFGRILEAKAILSSKEYFKVFNEPNRRTSLKNGNNYISVAYDDYTKPLDTMYNAFGMFTKGGISILISSRILDELNIRKDFSFLFDSLKYERIEDKKFDYCELQVKNKIPIEYFDSLIMPWHDFLRDFLYEDLNSLSKDKIIFKVRSKLLLVEDLKKFISDYEYTFPVKFLYGYREILSLEEEIEYISKKINEAKETGNAYKLIWK